jgi:hypothetical protein
MLHVSIVCKIVTNSIRIESLITTPFSTYVFQRYSDHQDSYLLQQAIN